jgi:hypothetical protein
MEHLDWISHPKSRPAMFMPANWTFVGAAAETGEAATGDEVGVAEEDCMAGDVGAVDGDGVADSEEAEVTFVSGRTRALKFIRSVREQMG